MLALIAGVLALIILPPSSVLADIYMHNPRGSNNRLDERSLERNNERRLFDSQNNDRGGYLQGTMSYYAGSRLQIEWQLFKFPHPAPIQVMYLSLIKGLINIRVKVPIQTAKQSSNICARITYGTDLDQSLMRNYILIGSRVRNYIVYNLQNYTGLEFELCQPELHH